MLTLDRFPYLTTSVESYWESWDVYSSYVSPNDPLCRESKFSSVVHNCWTRRETTFLCMIKILSPILEKKSCSILIIINNNKGRDMIYKMYIRDTRGIGGRFTCYLRDQNVFFRLRFFYFTELIVLSSSVTTLGPTLNSRRDEIFKSDGGICRGKARTTVVGVRYCRHHIAYLKLNF